MHYIENPFSFEGLPGGFRAGVKRRSQVLKEPVQRSSICLYNYIGVLGGAGHAMQIAGQGAGDHIGYPAFIQSSKHKLERLFHSHGRISRPSG